MDDRWTQQFVPVTKQTEFKNFATSHADSITPYVLADSPGTVTIVRHSLREEIVVGTFSYENDEWSLQLDTVQKYAGRPWRVQVIPLTVTEHLQVLIRNNRHEFVAYRHTYEVPNVYRWCVLSHNKLLVFDRDGLLKLLHIYENGFTLLDSTKFEKLCGGFDAVGGSAVAFYTPTNAGIISVVDDKMHISYWGKQLFSYETDARFMSKQISPFFFVSPIKVIALTSTSFVAITKLNIMIFDVTAKDPLFEIKLPRDASFNGCRISGKSFLIYESGRQDVNARLYKCVCGLWVVEKLPDMVFARSIIGLDIDSSFIVSPDGLEDLMVYRERSGVHTLSTLEVEWNSRIVDFSMAQMVVTKPNELCLYVPECQQLAFCKTKGESANNVLIDQIRRVASRESRLQWPYIVFVGEDGGVPTLQTLHIEKDEPVQRYEFTWFPNETKRTRLYTKDGLVCMGQIENMLDISIVYYATGKKTHVTGVALLSQDDWKWSWTDEKDSIFVLLPISDRVLCVNVRTKQVEYFGLDSERDWQNLDMVTGGLNFFFSEDVSKSGGRIMYAKLQNSEYKIESTDLYYDGTDILDCFKLSPQVQFVKDLGHVLLDNNSFLELSKERKITSSSPGWMTVCTISVNTYVRKYKCVEKSCSQQTDLFNMRCDTCKTNLPLADAKCRKLKNMPTCVPRLYKYFDDLGPGKMSTVILTKGTLLYHSTITTCKANQDPTGPVHSVFYEKGEAPKDTGVSFFGISPWISLTQHFYYRNEGLWGSEGYYTNLEEEIRQNAMYNNRPGALIVYELTEDVVLLDTTFNPASGTYDQSKKQFCETANMLCKGDKKEYQDNDFGLCCFALEKGMNGFVAFAFPDPVNASPPETIELQLRSTCYTKFYDASAFSKSHDLPVYLQKGMTRLYTWEVVMTDFANKLKLVTWTDACQVNDKTKPKDAPVLYNDMLAELQSKPSYNIKLPFCVEVIVKFDGKLTNIFVQITSKTVEFSETLRKPNIINTINSFLVDCLGLIDIPQTHIEKKPESKIYVTYLPRLDLRINFVDMYKILFTLENVNPDDFERMRQRYGLSDKQIIGTQEPIRGL